MVKAKRGLPWAYFLFVCFSFLSPPLSNTFLPLKIWLTGEWVWALQGNLTELRFLNLFNFRQNIWLYPPFIPIICNSSLWLMF